MYNLININLKKIFCHFGALSFFLITTSTTPFDNEMIRWYHSFITAILVYIVNGERIKWEYLGKFKKVYSILFFVIVLNIFFNPYSTIASIGLLVTNLSFFLLIPFMSKVEFKKVFLFTIIYIGIAKVFVVNEYMSTTTALFREMAGRGKDKNALGLLFGMAIIAIISSMILNRITEIKKISIIRLIFPISLIIIMLFSLLFSGSKSGLLSLIFSTFLLFLLIRKLKGNKKVGFMFIPLLAIAVIAGSIFISKYSNDPRFHIKNYIKLITMFKGEAKDYNNRIAMLVGGVNLIKQRPITGYGFTSENYIAGHNHHNTILTFWVELGIIGFLVLVFFIKFYLDELKFNINMLKLSPSNIGVYTSSALISLLPMFIMFFFLSLVSLVYFLLAFLASFTYKRTKDKYFLQP